MSETRPSARERPLADESVQMCVTSPPYWGLAERVMGWKRDSEATCETGPEAICRAALAAVGANE